MKFLDRLTLALALALASGFGLVMLMGNGASGAEQAKTRSYVVMGPDLAVLREDFNAKAGTVRLLFIVGPNCGVCLLGLEAINNELLAANDNPRLHTFVVHVPASGADEGDVAPAAQLLTGKNVTHYWEDTGIIGALYQEVLGRYEYVWDEWMIYGPGAGWEGEAPPKPDFHVHIMSRPEEFAEKTRELLASQ